MASLSRTRAQLRATFSVYRTHISAENTLADEDLEFKSRLKRTEAEALEAPELSRVLRDYCADVRSLKHYLPFLLDAAAVAAPSAPAMCEVLTAMKRHEFDTWPVLERRAVNDFLRARGL